MDQTKGSGNRATNATSPSQYCQEAGGKSCSDSYSAIHAGEDTLVLRSQQLGFAREPENLSASGWWILACRVWRKTPIVNPNTSCADTQCGIGPGSVRR